MNRAHVLGHLVVTTTRLAAEHPLLDPCTTHHHDGAWHAQGWCVRPRPTPGRALVVAWIGTRPAPLPPARLRGWGPFAMRHGGWGHWHPSRIRWRRPVSRQSTTAGECAEAPR